MAHIGICMYILCFIRWIECCGSSLKCFGLRMESLGRVANGLTGDRPQSLHSQDRTTPAYLKRFGDEQHGTWPGVSPREMGITPAMLARVVTVCRGGRSS